MGKNSGIMLEQEFQYYLDHQDELVEQYNGRFVVIKGEEVIGVFDSEPEAYFKMLEVHEPGTFLIQLCMAGEEAYTQTFNSHVIFE